MIIQTNTQQVIDALTVLKSRVSQQGMQAAYAGIGAVVQNEIQSNLGRGQSPWGIPFDPLLKPRKRQTARNWL